MYGQKIDPPPGVSSGLVGGEAATELILSPSSTIINFRDLAIYRIGLGESPIHQSSLLLPSKAYD